MLAPPPEDTMEANKSASQIHSLAWIIVLVSFAMFCSFSIAMSGGIYYFLFRSSVPMEVLAEVGQGSVGIVTLDSQDILRYPSSQARLSERPATLSTGTSDQANFSFNVTNQAGGESTTFGTLTLKNNSSITLQNARHPRFRWSHGMYILEFNNFSGEAEIFINQIPERPLTFRIRTQLGNATFVFDTVGRYSIRANTFSIGVTTYEGRALLASPGNLHNRFAVAGEQAILLTGANLPIVTAAPTNLINNGLFAFDISQDAETGLLQMPQQWGCSTAFEGPPSGEWYTDVWEGRYALRLIRESGDTTSRTGCRSWLDISVRDYTFLELRATFALNNQSLINCGFAGSECPMMIFIEYTDAQGALHVWHQSFFSIANYDLQNPAPLVCQACAPSYEAHRPITEQIWYTYESGNLFARIPEESRPAQILQVRFYASGHRYDVFVSEVALIAGSEIANVPTENVPPNEDN